MATFSNTFEAKSANHKSKLIGILKKYLFNPTEAGLYGLYLVFIVVLLLKLAAFILGFNDTIQIGSSDVMLSLIGFSLMFLIDIFKKRP